jgi:hypothetical protein
VIALQIIIIILFLVLLVRGFLYRDMPRVGGKFGPIRTIDPPPVVPRGFSRIYARAMTLFVASDAARFPTLKAFLRHGSEQQPMTMRIYRVAGCKTEIEIPDQAADYERIDAAQALALLRELPDQRLVRRLHLSDNPSFLDPWVHKVGDQELVHVGNATNFSLIVLYRPDRRLGQLLGLTLLHEWLHLVAFASTIQVWRFRRANAIEPLPSAALKLVNFGSRNTAAHEAWCDLGEKLFGYDESAAQQAALASPVHALIVWRCVDRILRRTPPHFRSTRFDELTQRGDFMRIEVEPKARAVRTGHPS